MWNNNGNGSFHPPGGWGNEPKNNWNNQQAGNRQNQGGDRTQNQLLTKVRECIDHQNIYASVRGNRNFEECFTKILTELRRESSMFDVQMSPYPSVHGNFQVVTLCGNLPIMYRGNRYDVYTKVTFSPGFPTEYPIVSIMNIDAARFKVHDKYLPNICPDGTFELNLASAMNFQYTMQFGPMLAEVQQVLGKDFPFYKNNTGGAQNVQKPDKYEYRAGVSGKPGAFQPNNQQGNNQPTWGGQQNQQGQQNHQGQQNQQGHQGQQNWGNNSGHARPPVDSLDMNLERNAKTELGVLCDTLKSDVNALAEDVRTMLNKAEEIKMRETTLNTQKAGLEKMTETVNQDIVTLTKYYEENNSKTLTEEVVDEIFHPANAQGKEIAMSLAKLRSLDEANKTMHDLYEDDKIKLSYDEMKKVVDKIAKEEYIVKAKLNMFMRN